MADFDEDKDYDEGSASTGNQRGARFGHVSGLVLTILKWVLIALVMLAIMFLVVHVVTEVKYGYDAEVDKFQMHSAQSKNIAAKPEILSWFDQLDQIRTETADVNPRSVMVKVSIGFDREDFETQTELIDRQIPIHDTIRSYFAKKRVSELRNEELIKRELKDQLNQMINTERIKDIVFKEYNIFEQ